MSEATAAASPTPSLMGDIAERLNRCKSLPSLPGVAVRIIELSESPTARLEDVANLVDAALERFDAAVATEIGLIAEPT